MGFVAAPTRERGAPTLERIRELTALLGTPQAEFPAVHLTGTNGKTSTARMLATLLEATGRSVGLATSPHLEHVRERIEWNGEPIDDASLARVLTQIEVTEEFLAELPSYFEIMVAAALTFFADVAVHVGVVEVGMGGTWDATNVVDADVAVVTNVGLDHMAFLGSTRPRSRPTRPASSGRTRRRARRDGSGAGADLRGPRARADVAARPRLRGAGSRLAHGGHLVDLYTPGVEYPEVFVPLHGAHQVDNAAIALAAAQAHVGTALDEESVHEGFARVTSPGRLEVMGTQPLDPARRRAQRRGGRRARPSARATNSRRNRARSSSASCGRRTRPRCSPRSTSPASSGSSAPARRRPRAGPGRRSPTRRWRSASRRTGSTCYADVGAAVDRARDITAADGQIVVTGSLYVVGAARAALH